MKLNLYVKTQSRVNKIERIDENNLKVFIKEPAKDGQANKAIIKILADYLNISPSRLKIKIGLRSKKKMVEIN